jgi:SAM-dependent methyltransferase
VSGFTINPYNKGFAEFGAAYEAIGFEQIHGAALPFLPSQAGLLLDIGAGSGRDAAWFARAGWDVVAVEPAAFMRQDARARHTSPRIRWIDDSLPALAAIHRLGLVFDIIWLSGVWMHVSPADRPRAMRKIATLLKPGGRLVLTLRHGPSPEDRPMWPVSANEVERLGLDLGLALRVATERADDLQGRPGVTWQTIILDLPDDGAGALPLLRGIILRQEKSATYKLALLRCIARIADASPNAAREAGDAVELPLGLIALYWLRLYKPLLDRNLRQRSGTSLSFVKDAYRALNHIAAADFRPGIIMSRDDGIVLARALADAARAIAGMPARHLTYANDVPVFETSYGRAPVAGNGFAATQENLWAFGVTRVPLIIWHALRRMAAWIEPTLVAEWARLIQSYTERTGGSAAPLGDIMQALRWIEPDRDTSFVKRLAQQHLQSGRPVQCVWTGQTLQARALDIDHCLPWSAWPCGDLWNLLPAAPVINRGDKGRRIVSSDTLNEARPRIQAWWQDAYLDHGEAVRVRFNEEAATSLPVLRGVAPDLEDVFLALDFKRLQLRQDTQAAEWAMSIKKGLLL